jgi:hypothetical protein
MNEVQLIRQQLALERQHVGAVAKACAALGTPDAAGSPVEAFAQFRRACVDYLACVLAWFEERDQRLAEHLQARSPIADPTRHALEEALARRGRSRETLAKLEAACAASAALAGSARQQAWREFGEYFESAWSARRDAIDALLASHSRVSDWRALGGIDADSILEERRRYALVQVQAPPGTALDTPANRD